MKLATWNVNSLNVRLPHVQDWLREKQPTVLALQETKLEDARFPAAELHASGYHAVFSGQKTYNGVALLAREPLSDVVAGIPGYADEQKRVLAGTTGGVRVICAYVPNGQSLESEKYAYKLSWLAAFRDYLGDALQRYPALAVVGDYNIAPEDQDVHDPKAWEGQVLVSEPERSRYREILALGFSDCFRRFPQPEASYSWWDYRAAGFRRNLGLRIDLILASLPLAEQCTGCEIDKAPRKLERPSDHAPVMAEFRWP